MKKILICFSLFFLSDKNLWSQTKIRFSETNQTIYPFSLQPSSSFNDIQILQSYFSSKKVVALGEATHGSKEFYQAKSKLVKYLFTSCGFKNLNIEASFGSCLYINDFVKGKGGTIDSAIHKLQSWIFYTKEIKDLLLWMHEFNKKKKEFEQIGFYGFDSQSLTDCIEFIKHNISNSAPEAKKQFLDITLSIAFPVSSKIATRLKTENKELYESLLSTVNQLKQWIQKNHIELKENHTQEIYETMKIAINASDQFILSPNKPYRYRDSCMAQIFLQILSINPNEKHIIWAHNQHISTFDTLVNYDTYRQTMGHYIHDSLKTMYYPIGFFFNSGSFLALEPKKRKGILTYPNLNVFTLPNSDKHSLGDILSKTGYPVFFIDLEKPDNLVFRKYYKTYMTGAAYSKNNSNNTLYITPSYAFKGLIFIDQVTHTDQIDTFYYPTKKL